MNHTVASSTAFEFVRSTINPGESDELPPSGVNSIIEYGYELDCVDDNLTLRLLVFPDPLLEVDAVVPINLLECAELSEYTLKPFVLNTIVPFPPPHSAEHDSQDELCIKILS